MSEEKKVVKKTLDDYHDDIVNYISQRILLSINATEDKEIVEGTEAYVDAVLFLLIGDESIKETLHRVISIDDLKEEFNDKFGNRYDLDCNCCGNKESENNNVEESCGGC